MRGTVGSGKSEAGIMRLVLLMLENYSIRRVPIVTLAAFPTYDLCKLRGMSGLEEILERIGLPFTTNKSDFEVTMPPYGSMLFRSYDRPERIVSFEAAFSVCDELDTLPKEKAALVWRKVSERTRLPAHLPNSIAAVTTPDQGTNGFIYDKWVKRRQKGYYLIKAPTSSNPFLPDGYIEQIMANYDPVLAACYLNGDFVSLNQNKVYHFFDRNRHSTDRVITAKDTHLHASIDFNIGGCCATVTVYDGDAPSVVDEFVSHDTRDFLNNLAARYRNKRIVIYPDASGKAERTNATASDIALIQQEGYQVDAPSKNPFVRDRINSVNGLISHDQIKINVDKCPNLAHALESQGYNKKGEPEKYDTHPAIDDWTDSFGYFIHRRHAIVKPVTKVAFNF